MGFDGITCPPVDPPVVLFVILVVIVDVTVTEITAAVISVISHVSVIWNQRQWELTVKYALRSITSIHQPMTMSVKSANVTGVVLHTAGAAWYIYFMLYFNLCMCIDVEI